jgi:hypothetical protein
VAERQLTKRSKMGKPIHIAMYNMLNPESLPDSHHCQVENDGLGTDWAAEEPGER